MKPPPGGTWDTFEHRAADALLELCRQVRDARSDGSGSDTEACEHTPTLATKAVLVVEVPQVGPATIAGVPIADAMLEQLRANATHRARARRRRRPAARDRPAAVCALVEDQPRGPAARRTLSLAGLRPPPRTRDPPPRPTQLRRHRRHRQPRRRLRHASPSADPPRPVGVDGQPQPTRRAPSRPLRPDHQGGSPRARRPTATTKTRHLTCTVAPSHGQDSRRIGPTRARTRDGHTAWPEPADRALTSTLTTEATRTRRPAHGESRVGTAPADRGRESAGRRPRRASAPNATRRLPYRGTAGRWRKRRSRRRVSLGTNSASAWRASRQASRAWVQERGSSSSGAWSTLSSGRVGAGERVAVDGLERGDAFDEQLGAGGAVRALVLVDQASELGAHDAVGVAARGELRGELLDLLGLVDLELCERGVHRCLGLRDVRGRARARAVGRPRARRRTRRARRRTDRPGRGRGRVVHRRAGWRARRAARRRPRRASAARITSGPRYAKSTRWQRDRIVSSSWSAPAVTSTMSAVSGGSSSVFSSLLAACSLRRSASNTRIALRAPSTGLRVGLVEDRLRVLDADLRGRGVDLDDVGVHTAQRELERALVVGCEHRRGEAARRVFDPGARRADEEIRVRRTLRGTAQHRDRFVLAHHRSHPTCSLTIFGVLIGARRGSVSTLAALVPAMLVVLAVSIALMVPGVRRPR